MTKIFYAIIFIGLMISNNSQAQSKIYGGFKLAPNYSIITDKVENLKSGIGYSVGYFEVLELENKINLQAEINYTNNSFVIDLNSGGINTKTTIKNNSVELPLMVKYRPNDNFSIGLGYQFSFFSSKSEKTKTTGQADENINDKGISSNGVFLDANIKTKKTIIGLRVLKTSESIIEPFESINASFYVGFALF
jgi:hypothetical protein